MATEQNFTEQNYVDTLYYQIIGTSGFLDETRRVVPEVLEKINNNSLFLELVGKDLEGSNEFQKDMGMNDKEFHAFCFNVSNMLKNQLKNNGYLSVKK